MAMRQRAMRRSDISLNSAARGMRKVEIGGLCEVKHEFESYNMLNFRTVKILMGIMWSVDEPQWQMMRVLIFVSQEPDKLLLAQR